MLFSWLGPGSLKAGHFRFDVQRFFLAGNDNSAMFCKDDTEARKQFLMLFDNLRSHTFVGQNKLLNEHRVYLMGESAELVADVTNLSLAAPLRLASYHVVLTPLKHVQTAPVSKRLSIIVDTVGDYKLTLTDETWPYPRDIVSNFTLQCQQDYNQVGSVCQPRSSKTDPKALIMGICVGVVLVLCVLLLLYFIRKNPKKASKIAASFMRTGNGLTVNLNPLLLQLVCSHTVMASKLFFQ